MILRVIVWILLAISVGGNVLLWNAYQKKETVTQVINNVADTIVQTYYIPAMPGKVTGPGIPIGTIANAVTGVYNRSLILTGGLEYMPGHVVPISYELGAMYFHGRYGIGYSYNPWLRSHQIKVGVRIGK